MEPFSTPILQHPRFTLWVTPAIVLAGVILANLIWWGGKQLGLGRGVVAPLALVAFFGALPVAVLVLRTHLGELEFTGRELVARMKDSVETRVDLSRATWEVRIWRTSLVKRNVGLVIIVRDPDERLVIGASAPAMVADPVARGAELTLVPPAVRISGDALRRVVQALEAARPRAGA